MPRASLVASIVGLILIVAACGSATAGTRLTDLQVGDCYNESATTGPTVSLLPTGGTQDAEVTRVSCSEAHTFEVFGLASDPAGPGTDYPGEQAEFDRSDQACAAPFQEYVGIDYQASHLHARIRTPAEAAWASGDRAFVCALFDPDQARLTGSQKGSFVPYTSAAFRFTVSIPSGWTAGPKPGDATGTLLSGPDATIVVGVDPAGSASQDEFVAADARELTSAGASELMTASFQAGGLDWSITQYTLPTTAASTFGIDALAVDRGRSFLLIWASDPGNEAVDLGRFVEILSSFRSAP